jgi:hypothetical protein
MSVIVEIEVVHDAETQAERFVRLEKMAYVGSRIAMPAYGTAAAFLDRPRVGLILRVADMQCTVSGVKIAVAAVAARIDAVEEIDAARHSFEDVFRCAYPMR